MYVYTRTSHVIIIPGLQSNITEDNLGERTAMVAEVVQEAEQTENNAQLVRNVVQATAAFARIDPSVVDEEVIIFIKRILKIQKNKKEVMYNYTYHHLH